MKHYRLTANSILLPDQTALTTYGVILVEDGIVRAEAPDLSPDRKAVEALVEVFSREELEAVHFEQAIEDFLYDFRI